MTIFLSNLLAIYRRELQSYFSSPFAYGIAVVFWLIGGMFLSVILLGPDGVIATVSASDQLGLNPQPVDVPYEFLK
ncbi:MAG: ABC transporter permease, partial [Cyanobacteria bacterium J06643_4]